MKRVEVLKTYKIFIGGAFPRTESGRYYPLLNKQGKTIANICLSSKKDLRNAVVAARNACAGWAAKTAYNRSQILYRMAEMLETRKAQFADELLKQGFAKQQAEKEIIASIDRLIYYAGWCDKYMQIYSSVNPVATSHFNFSLPEPMGVVGILAPENSSLLGLISAITPCVAGGNTCVVLASYTLPLCAISFAEVIQCSDVPAGVINILTGSKKELLEHFSNHMDINAVVYFDNKYEELKKLKTQAALNVKRIVTQTLNDEDPYKILDLQEIKTTWHPIENIGSGGGGY
jgi:acyl-CoA reductase-like NAD-dependent aldehyde dehydrogenase